MGYSPWGRKESDMTQVTEHSVHGATQVSKTPEKLVKKAFIIVSLDCTFMIRSCSNDKFKTHGT